VNRRFDARFTVSRFLAFLALLVVVSAAAAPVAVPPAARAHPGVNFAARDAMFDLSGSLSYQMKDQNGPGEWFMMTAANQSVHPVTRILVAGEPSNAALHIFPPRGRPQIYQVASSDSDVDVVKARAYGRHVWRVTIPPATTAALAIGIENAQGRQPGVQAWTEPAFIFHIRQLSVFMAAVQGLIAAAILVAAGLALMTGHLAPRWTAIVLLGVFLTRLAAGGTFDAGWTTYVGGPYGLSAMIAGLTLAAGLRLADIVVPIDGLIADARRRMRWLLLGVTVVSLLAFIGAPGAILLTDVAILVGTGAITAYLVNRGIAGVQAARVAAPSAAVFSLVATAGAIAALGGFQSNPMAPAMVGGFLAAGAVLLTLAVAAGEGIAILPAVRATANAAPARDAPQLAAEAAAPEPVRPDLAAAQAIGASCQGVFDLDFRGDAVKLSGDAAGLIGLEKGETTLAHISWVARIHPDDREIYKQAVSNYRAHPGAAFRVEFRARSESGRYPWFELRATMLGPESGHGPATRCLGLMADITTRKESEAAAMDRTLRDPLTGLGNRVALMGELEQRGLSHVIFALLDIDRFKSIHASLGDDGADAVLTAAAQRLTKRFKGRADAFRTGGDAFALLFVEGDAETIGAELVETCKAPHALGGRSVFAPASVGVALGGEARDPLDLLKNAELALIQAKRQGGCCARRYSADLAAPEDAVALEAELRRALDEKQMDVFYQPIVRLSDATVAGFEALLRWRHPTRGLVVPGEFIAHSEATGLIVALGRFALERAGTDLAQWQRFFPLEPPLFVSVNVSRRQLGDGSLEEDVSRVLAQASLQPGSLKLELTESAAGTGEDGHAALSRLRALGAGLAIDDFGTGVSSLSQLRGSPFDTIKIDKSFLARGESDDDVVLQSIVRMAQELGLGVVVEGVEREQDADRLADLGCEFAQGFFFSGPLPADDALAFIARHYRTEAASRDESAPGEVGESGAAGVNRQA